LVDLEATVEWWSALVVLGALLIGVGLAVWANAGEAITVAGVAVFLGTGVAAGVERVELATALGTGAVVSTALGIALVLGTDASRFGTFLALVVVGSTFVSGGGAGWDRARASTKPITGEGR
jgi:hypothetical protein